MFFYKHVVLVIALIVMAYDAQAGKSSKDIYPFIPIDENFIHNKVKEFSEDEDYIKNFFSIIENKLSQAKTKVKPWTSTYWPLNRGTIADPYENSFIGYYFETGTVSWMKNYNNFRARKKLILDQVDNLTQGQLNKLAPSEKYDLLLGDKDFSLTKVLWDYTHAWGSKKKYGFEHFTYLVGDEFPHPTRPDETVDALFLAKEMTDKQMYGFTSVEEMLEKALRLNSSLSSQKALSLINEDNQASIDSVWPKALEWAKKESKNYVIEKKNNLMGFWEGICHGWATAAGIIPRPRQSIEFKLHDGKKITFYPADVKALISLAWAHSLVQDNKVINPDGSIYGGVIGAGLRCNQKAVAKDDYGRVYDSLKDPFTKQYQPRCVGIHPAIWHLSLVNVVGKQGRSFVVDRKVDAVVDNHPLYSYKMKYFNPKTGHSYKNLNKNIIPLSRRDQFYKMRNPKTKYVVGVETTMKYLDWERPKRVKIDKESYDSTVKKKMFYDLELDESYNIIGGQWRAVKAGIPGRSRRTEGSGKLRLNHNQPDFIWTITKHWKSSFKEENIEPWIDLKKAPPKSWKEAAQSSHNFIYKNFYKFGTGDTCVFFNKRTGKSKQVSCEFNTPKPYPLLNVVNKLIELSK